MLFGKVLSLFLIVLGAGVAWSPVQVAESLGCEPMRYPASLEPLARKLQEEYGRGAPSIELLVHLAEVYLGMGEDLYVEESTRLDAYRKGAEYAGQALHRGPENADAHFLYAANLGHVAQLKGLFAAALSLNEIFSHVKTAVSLDPGHAGALHMLGMMYDGVPWIMGGDTGKALHFLQQAVAADPNYSHARLNLAKLYLKREDYHLARQELEAILAIRNPRAMYPWAHAHVPEARELLKTFSAQGIVADPIGQDS